MTVPNGVERFGFAAFSGCDGMTEITLPDQLTDIGDSALSSCTRLKRLVIPNGVTNVGKRAFADCESLTNIVFKGSMPTFGDNVFDWLPDNFVLTVEDPTGWDYYSKRDITPPWESFKMYKTVGLEHVGDWSNQTTTVYHHLTITNIVLHYVMTPSQSQMTAPVSQDVGLVTVITEVKGGAVPVPTTWAENYPTFSERFGEDFGAALAKPSGKRDAAGNAMTVWQDFVAGTDPTDSNDVFRATVTLTNGVPYICYTPELTPAEKAKRVYKTLGKVRLQDAAWVEIAPGDEGNYNFFKVTVEMK